ncbi:unnamed protein product [Parnassius mnemosyne]|uniref:Uncharacterized protein n=1 Tax=Parnassius mnemosyne TaxID=213953 RepID=A0AAV1LF02_9NEOP
MNLEEMYQTLRGASGEEGAKFDVVQKWFTQCNIIDGKYVTDSLFTCSYQRLCPNNEPLSLTKFIQLLGILAKESKRDVKMFEERFRTVHKQIVDEILKSRSEEKQTQTN